MITILLKFNEKVLKTIEFDKDVISIGRSSNSDIRIENLSVSKNHARIVKEQDGYVIEDLGSTNGTFVNETAAARQPLNHEDVVTIGKHTLLVLQGKVRPLGAADTQEETKDTMMLTTEKHKKMLEKQK